MNHRPFMMQCTRCARFFYAWRLVPDICPACWHGGARNVAGCSGC